MSNFNTYEWSFMSAWNKATSDLSLSVGVPPVAISKKITKTHNPEKDAYRACKHCGKHINYHENGKCPK
tara:strand:+ start:481 stop:687 length:207 start_codon:yes stop_codon:yes gene_type:complete